MAIKVLPDDLAENRERLARFEQEARSASALNHPNIVTIHDIGRERSISYISMELVEGHTLRELLAAGPLPIKRLLDLAAQVADGLATAHSVGMVHRDLKPENLMIALNGFIKILDFGLAKPEDPQEQDQTETATLGGFRTEAGVVLGTAGLHVSGAGERPEGRLPVRPIRLRGHPLRDGDGAAGLPAGIACRDARGDRAGRARADRIGQPGSARAAGLDHRAVSGQEAGGTLRVDPGPRPGSRDTSGPIHGCHGPRGGGEVPQQPPRSEDSAGRPRKGSGRGRRAAGPSGRSPRHAHGPRAASGRPASDSRSPSVCWSSFRAACPSSRSRR